MAFVDLTVKRVHNPVKLEASRIVPNRQLPYAIGMAVIQPHHPFAQMLRDLGLIQDKTVPRRSVDIGKRDEVIDSIPRFANQ